MQSSARPSPHGQHTSSHFGRQIGFARAVVMPLALATVLGLSGCGLTVTPVSVAATTATPVMAGATPTTTATTEEACTPSTDTSAVTNAPAFTGHAGPFNKPQWSAPPPMIIDTSKKYQAAIVTNKGTIVILMDPSKTPKTVNNFVFLAREHFYDCLTFHRYVPGFVIQGGDPLGTGSGGPGYAFADELPADSTVYTVGAVAMANAGPNTNGSQFFIDTVDDTAQLQASYSIIGNVTAGLDVVTALRQGDYMKTVTITEK